MDSFSVIDQAAWDHFVKVNNGPYGACVVRYAAAWAHLMETEMDAGAKLKGIAKKTSHTADTEGITGFMYGAAVATLAVVWKHGEELRRWHNLNSQIGTEGEKANKEGGTLNPAIINIS